MVWKKLGRIFIPDGHLTWANTHASTPCAVQLEGDRYRIYFSSRDKIQRSSIGFLEISLKDPERILLVNELPILVPGERGLFDDNGVSMGHIVEHAGQLYLYYVGWNLAVTVPFRNSIGLAIKTPTEANFIKYSQAPVLDRSNEDPFSLSYPWIIKEKNQFRMWYGSHLTWEAGELDMQHVIKCAESDDGIHWKRTKQICISLGVDESGLSRPSILKDATGCYHMWFSRRLGRKETYRIGYATSVDGFNWTRDDSHAGIDISEEGWDSEMICYPCVFEYNSTLYMLYNGNGFGRSGFGLAMRAP